MESGKKSKSKSASGSGSASASTGSSISTELFGPRASATHNTSTGIFDSVFSQPSSNSRSEVVGSWRKNDDYENQGWNNSKQKYSGNAPQGGESQARSSVFQERGVEPYPLSSAIYYGAREVYSTPSDSHSPTSPYAYKKDDERDDDPNGHNNLHSASRGNWWQGGLYY